MNKHELLRKSIIGIFSIIGVLLIILGVLKSDFRTVKKFEGGGKSPRDMMSSSSPKVNRSAYSTSVSIGSDSVANLGDFTFNVGGDKKLITNISLKYEQKGDKGWFSDDKKIKNEIMKKGTILRDATIDVMMGNPNLQADSTEMRNTLKKSINNKLNEGEIKEVYFNKFIIQ